MASRIRIFDQKTLAPTAPINASATYSWKLNDVARCEFELDNLDLNCTEPILRFGNLVHIEHLPTRQADGTLNGILPTWTGVIMPPRDWPLGKVAVTAYSAEYILKKRPLPLMTRSGTPAVMFNDILNQSNSWLKIGYPVQAGNVDSNTDQEFSDEYSGSALDHLQKLSATTGCDFQVRGVLNDVNQLNLLCDWQFPLGIDVGQLFSSLNSKVGGTILSEQGEFNTVIEAYSDASADSTRVHVEVFDPNAFNDYGFWAENIAFDGVFAEAPLIAAAQQTVNNSSRPVRIFDFMGLDVGDTFSYLSVGNIWNVRIKTAGFMDDGTIGFEGKVRITSMEYSDLDNQCRLSLETLT